MYPPIATDGALKAAELICGLFQERIQPH
jgi:hypothetical protein